MMVGYADTSVNRWRHADSPPWEPERRPLRPLLIPTVAVVALLSQVIVPGGQSWLPWLVALSFGTFVLAINSSALLLVPIIVSELTLYSYVLQPLGTAQRFGLVLLAFVLALPTISRARLLGDVRFRRVFLPSVIFITLATVMNAAYSQDTYVLQYFRYQIIQLLVLVLASSLIRTRQDLRRLVVVALLISLISAIAAIWQHYAPVSAPYGPNDAGSVEDWKGRAIGFSGSPVALADQMTLVLVPVMGMLLCMAWRIDRIRILLGVSALLLLAGLNFSYTRSGVFALGPGLVMMGLLLRGSRRMMILGFVGMMIFVFPMLENTGLIGDRYFNDSSNDQSTRTHDALWDVGVAIALDNAVTGIGHEHFEETVLLYLDSVDTGSEFVSTEDAIGQRPHNDFLSVWVGWGIFALITYIAIFLGTLRNLIAAARHDDILIRGLAVGCAGGVVVYAVSSAYHNYLDSSMSLWIYAGISVALARLAATTPVASRMQPPIVPS